tara:strand:+ start:1200 stop:1349 length:150 start_codon:yes stop_codon:yes gene_type:complete
MVNIFSITFNHSEKGRITEDFVLGFHSVNKVKEWFEETFEKSALSITKH